MMSPVLSVLLFFVVLAVGALQSVVLADSPMLIGAGIGDVTGQITEVGFMGYAVPNQKGSGLHFRSRARAFIFVDRQTGERAVYVSIDLCMGFEQLKTFVVEQLSRVFGPQLYRRDNVILSGTHTHSTPGGLGATVLVDMTTFGFSKDNFDAAVTGIVTSIQRAHAQLKPGRILYGETELDDTVSVNRSPASYLMDPDYERAQYKYNTDKTMHMLRLQADDGTEIGAIDFYAVHAVSMNNTNTLVSGDNKGLASQLFERYKNGHSSLSGVGPFVAAFGNSNEGDVSPNTQGAKCPDGTPCDFVHSTCGGKTEQCIAAGPGRDMWESTEIIANKQFEAARALYDNINALTDVSAQGQVVSRHMYVNMQTLTVDAKYTSTNKTEKTCEPALGYAFAGGTTDGPGDFDFTQGELSPNPFWAFVSGFLSKPTADQIACHAPKPILLNVGSTKPYEWTPFILPLQIVRVGELFFVAVPGEFTTMSGRRLRQTVETALKANGNVWTTNSRVIITGLSNSYSHYIATYEEYQLQRYEGGSTLYGPHTLAAYMQEYSVLAAALASNSTVDPGPQPNDMRNLTISLLPGVVVDGVPSGKFFGAVEQQPAAQYTVNQTVTAIFWCASPRNDVLNEKSFLTVELVTEGGAQTTTVANDSAWETKFYWKRQSVDQSLCTVEWSIPADATAGTYQIRSFGVSKGLLGEKTPFQGLTNTFTVSA